MTIERKFTRGVAWMAFGNWTEQAINFAVFALLARLLGAGAFGLLAMASALVILSEALVRESLSEYVIAAPDLSEEDLNAVFWLLAGLGVFLSLVLAAVAVPVANFYGEPALVPVVRALAPLVFVKSLDAVPAGILRRDLNLRTLSIRAVAGVVAGGVVGIGLALSGAGIWALVGHRAATVITNVFLAWTATPWRPGFRARTTRLREMIRFGVHILGLRGAEIAALQLPTLTIGAVLGPVQVGYFSLSWRLVEIGSFLIVTPIRTAAQSAFAALRREKAAAAPFLVDLLAMTGLLAFPAFLGMSMLAGPLLTLVFGPGWTAAAAALSPLSLYGIYLCLGLIEQAFCLALGRVGYLAALGWIAAGTAAAVAYLSSPGGLPAMTGAFVAVYYVLWLARIWFVARLADLEAGSLLRLHAVPATAGLTMAAVVWAVLQTLGAGPPVVAIGLGALSGAAVYGAIAWYTMRDRLMLLRSYVAMTRGGPAGAASGS
ncbi:MAG: oligosaccharide flippase family protein [Rhodobacteraceae bacterium]|nr:oligosaccharide flippase family protein [Paracoccaceae bacterium]